MVIRRYVRTQETILSLLKRRLYLICQNAFLTNRQNCYFFFYLQGFSRVDKPCYLCFNIISKRRTIWPFCLSFYLRLRGSWKTDFENRWKETFVYEERDFLQNARLHAIIGDFVTDNMQMTNTQHEKKQRLDS